MIATGIARTLPRCGRCHGNVFVDADGDWSCLLCGDVGRVEAGVLHTWTHEPTAEEDAVRRRAHVFGPRPIITDPDIAAVQARRAVQMAFEEAG